CCCGVEEAKEAEAPFEQRLSVGVSQARTPKAALSSQKTHPCEMQNPVLREILAEHQGTQHSHKVFRCRVCMKLFYVTADFEKHQKQHMEKKPTKSSVDRALFVKSYKCCCASENPFISEKVGKDFLTTLGCLQQATHTGKKPNKITQCGEDLRGPADGSLVGGANTPARCLRSARAALPRSPCVKGQE
ncbi:hypothetical protein MC885_017762, partial [Smutsia gigantea]